MDGSALRNTKFLAEGKYMSIKQVENDLKMLGNFDIGKIDGQNACVTLDDKFIYSETCPPPLEIPESKIKLGTIYPEITEIPIELIGSCLVARASNHLKHQSPTFNKFLEHIIPKTLTENSKAYRVPLKNTNGYHVLYYRTADGTLSWEHPQLEYVKKVTTELEKRQLIDDIDFLLTFKSWAEDLHLSSANLLRNAKGFHRYKVNSARQRLLEWLRSQFEAESQWTLDTQKEILETKKDEVLSSLTWILQFTENFWNNLHPENEASTCVIIPNTNVDHKEYVKTALCAKYLEKYAPPTAPTAEVEDENSDVESIVLSEPQTVGMTATPPSQEEASSVEENPSLTSNDELEKESVLSEETSSVSDSGNNVKAEIVSRSSIEGCGFEGNVCLRESSNKSLESRSEVAIAVPADMCSGLMDTPPPSEPEDGTFACVDGDGSSAFPNLSLPLLSSPSATRVRRRGLSLSGRHGQGKEVSSSSFTLPGEVLTFCDSASSSFFDSVSENKRRASFSKHLVSYTCPGTSLIRVVDDDGDSV